jgi:hypothetical protein
LAAIYYVLGAKQHTRRIASTGGPGRLRKEPIVIRDLSGAVLPGSPADFAKLIAEEIEKWGKVIRAANIKAE